MGFFLNWTRQQPVEIDFFSLLQQHSLLQLQTAADGFVLSATERAEALEARQGVKARICWFGAPLGTEKLAQLLELLRAEQSTVLLSAGSPHPDLTAACYLGLSQPLSESLQTKLKDFGSSIAAELVYLDGSVCLTSPGLLVMDMDSTAIQIECIDEIAVLAGVGEQVAAVTARAMNGELDFAQSLTQRVAALAGAPQTVLVDVLQQLPLMPGLTALVAHLQARQWQVVIASGGFTYFTDALKAQLGLTATYANVLEIADGKLTGKVLGAIVDAQRKAEVVAQVAAEYQIPHSQTVAIGDGANDLPMLAKAALGVAFHAKPKVQAQAKAAIRQGSLLQLLYLLDAAL